MAENSFTGGMKDVMSLFMMSSMAANYDAQRENMEENRRLREVNLQRQFEEDKRQTMTADMETLKLVSNPKNNIPDDVANSQLNRIISKYNFGQPVSLDDARAFGGELDAFTKRSDLVTGDERRAAYQQFADKAGSNVIYTREYLKRADAVNNYLERPGMEAAFQTAGFNKRTTDRLLQNVSSGEAMALLKDGDWRKQAILNQANTVTQKVLNGDPDVADGELAQALSAAYGAGFKIGNDGAEIVKGTTGEAQYNLAQKDLDSLNSTSIKPLTQLWKTLPQDKAILALARRGPSGGLASIGLEQDDAVASLLPQEQQKAYHDSVAKLEATYDQASKSWKDFEARYRIAKANPNTTSADMILLDQQRKVEQEKYRALISPHIAYRTFLDAPTDENFKKVLNASTAADTTLRRWESDKNQLMTTSEQKAKDEIETGKQTRNIKMATNDFGGRFLETIGQNADVYDADGTMDIPKAAKLATPLVKEINAKYNTNLDATEVIKELASAGKRTVPNSNTLSKLSPEQGAKFETFVAGERLTQDVKGMLIKDGVVDRKLLATAIAGGLPFTQGRTLEASILDAMESEYRARTGAAMPEEEVKRAKKIFVPSNLDSDKTIAGKLDNLEQHFHDKIQLVDPDGQLRKRLTPLPKTKLKGDVKSDVQEAQPQAKAPWDDRMDAKARELIKAHPDWGVEQLSQELRKVQ